MAESRTEAIEAPSVLQLWSHVQGKVTSDIGDPECVSDPNAELPPGAPEAFQAIHVERINREIKDIVGGTPSEDMRIDYTPPK